MVPGVAWQVVMVALIAALQAAIGELEAMGDGWALVIALALGVVVKAIEVWIGEAKGMRGLGEVSRWRRFWLG